MSSILPLHILAEHWCGFRPTHHGLRLRHPHPVLSCVVAWNLPAIAFEYLAEDLQNLHYGAKTAVRTGVYQYAELDHQKRISMSGNSVESNSFCSLLKVAIVTSFFWL